MLVASDEAVKTIFDHFRNIGIAGAVFAAGIWSIKHPATGLMTYMSLISGISLCALGVFLLVIAERHGRKKFKEANLPLRWEFLAIFIYSTSLLSLFSIAAQKI
ncbi:hypothetical protein [Burkholderia arboris]|uniref:hypothetical protein n=1 Tax=Burkholderia arboris TaxID=488730 RepID=UPI0012D9DDCD|nr:hypothetical protein [Burkholderia arboris]MCA8493715.1 hypothetical protein [Burkholderia arboris]